MFLHGATRCDLDAPTRGPMGGVEKGRDSYRYGGSTILSGQAGLPAHSPCGHLVGSRLASRRTDARGNVPSCPSQPTGSSSASCRYCRCRPCRRPRDRRSWARPPLSAAPSAAHPTLQLQRSGPTTYQRARWLLHMLRERTGDEVLWRGVRHYYARHMNGTASTDDFMRAMEEASGMDHAASSTSGSAKGAIPASRAHGSTMTLRAPSAWNSRRSRRQAILPCPWRFRFYGEGEPLPYRVATLETAGGRQTFAIPVSAPPIDARLDPAVRALFQADFRPSRPTPTGRLP